MPYVVLNFDLDSLPHAFIVFDTMLLSIVHTFQLAIVHLLLKLSVCSGEQVLIDFAHVCCLYLNIIPSACVHFIPKL